MSQSRSPFQPPTGSSNEDKQATADTDSAQVAYNVVTDLVTGVNVRWSDNKFQAVFIGCAVLACALLGAILSLVQPSWNLPWYGGALIGGFLGLMIGFFTSGIFLMIYRAIKHMRGNHD